MNENLEQLLKQTTHRTFQHSWCKQDEKRIVEDLYGLSHTGGFFILGMTSDYEVRGLKNETALELQSKLQCHSRKGKRLHGLIDCFSVYEMEDFQNFPTIIIVITIKKRSLI